MDFGDPEEWARRASDLWESGCRMGAEAFAAVPPDPFDPVPALAALCAALFGGALSRADALLFSGRAGRQGAAGASIRPAAAVAGALAAAGMASGSAWLVLAAAAGALASWPPKAPWNRSSRSVAALCVASLALGLWALPETRSGCGSAPLPKVLACKAAGSAEAASRVARSWFSSSVTSPAP